MDTAFVESATEINEMKGSMVKNNKSTNTN